MTTEGSGGSKLAELVSDHVLGDVHGNVTTAVVDCDGVSYKGREDSSGTAPGLENLLLALLIHFVDSLQELGSCEGSFFNASAHLLLSLLT